ncbi:MAG: polysaccharide biosynthesis tyrosine autokinase [Granulosicoccus sp.]
METIASKQNEQQDLRYYLRIIFSYRAPIFWCNLTVFILASIYTSAATPLYRAKAVLLIDPTTINVSTFAEGMAAKVEYKEFYETQFQLLLSRSLAHKVVDRLQLWQNNELLPSNSLDRAVSYASNNSEARPLHPLVSTSRLQRQVLDNFIARLRIKSIKKTKLITIRYDSESPVLAARVANALAQQYIENNLTLRKTYSRNRTESLRLSLANVGILIKESQAKLRVLHEQNPELSVQSLVTRLDNKTLLQANAELSESRKQLLRLTGQKHTVNEAHRDYSALLNLSLISNDRLVQSVQSDLDTKRQKLTILKNRYDEHHPLVNDATAEVNSLETTLQLNIDRAANSIIIKHRLAKQRVFGAERRLHSYKQAMSEQVTPRQKLASLEHNDTKLQELYSTLFVKMLLANGAEDIVPNQASIADYATPPSLHYRPRKLIFVGLALISSLIFSVLASGIAARLNDKIRNPEDVEKLKLRILGILPQIRSDLCSPDTPFIEAVNTIRTALVHGNGVLQSQIVLITSSLPGEGKSTAAINLAHSFSRNDERVLLIDCDIRNPAIAVAAGFPKHSKGFSSILENSATLSDCIRTGTFNGAFDILPSGPVTGHPLELISSVRLAVILDHLRKFYDRIILDSAPVLAVSDSLILSNQCDSVIYIVKTTSVTHAQVRRGLARLQQVNAPIAGIAISQFNTTKAQPQDKVFKFLEFSRHKVYGIARQFRIFSQALKAFWITNQRHNNPHAVQTSLL